VVIGRLGCGTSSRDLLGFTRTGAGSLFEIEWGDSMKKLLGSSFRWMRGWHESQTIHGKEFAAAGLVKLWQLSAAVLLGTIFLGFSAPVMGQAINATLLGTVTDASSAVVAGAKITITEMKTGVVHMVNTNESGNYEVPDLAPGQYEVAAEMQGF